MLVLTLALAGVGVIDDWWQMAAVFVVTWLLGETIQGETIQSFCCTTLFVVLLEVFGGFVM